MNDMAKIDLKYVQAFKDRHGRMRYYYRRKGRAKVALPGSPGTAEFMAAYTGAADSPEIRSHGEKRTVPKTINALVVAYYLSTRFKNRLSDKTKQDYRLVLDAFRQKHGDKSALTIQPKHLDAIFETMGDRPAAAANLRKRLFSVFKVAVKLGWRHDNPVRETESLAVATDGFAPWTEEDMAAFEKRWPSGTRERLAYALLLHAGLRRSDAVKAGRQHVAEGLLTLRQTKGDAGLIISVHPALQAEIDLAPLGMTFLITQYGNPFSPAGFTQWFVERAVMAGVTGKTPHGLRKAHGRHLAEAGASENEIAAGLGHRSTATARIYTRSAAQKKLAMSGMARLSGAKPEQLVSNRLDTLDTGS